MQPQSDALTGYIIVSCLIEWLEEQGQIVLRNSLACVLHFEVEPAGIRANPEGHLSLRREFHGVPQQIVEDLP